MKIAFTICTNSFLSLVRTLGKSMQQHNPDYAFFIGLCDRHEPDLEDLYKDHTVIPCGDIGIAGFDEMVLKYDLRDMKNALKPFFMEYFASKYPQAELIVFLDPDLMVYDRFDEVEALHREHDILLTPHLLQPQPFDGKHPTEIAYLANGTFNAGFMSVKINENTFRFMRWWGERLRKYCYIDWKAGLVHDQKWLIMAPVFFEKVHAMKHPGYNIGYWNLHERKLSRQGGKVMVNERHPLVVYHFSNVDIAKGKLFTDQQNRFTEADVPVNKELFIEYCNMIMQEGFDRTSRKKCYYAGLHDEHVRKQLSKSLSGRFKLFLKRIIPVSLRVKLKERLARFLD